MNSKQRNSLNIKYRRLGFSAMLLLVLLLAACNRSNVQAAGPTAPPPPLVTVVQTSAQDVPKYLDEIGRNGAYESVTVTPQVGGRIIERRFQDRQHPAAEEGAAAGLSKKRGRLIWPFFATVTSNGSRSR